MGRTAQVFAISERSGWMLGLDVGGTHVHALAVSLDGSLLQEERSNVSERLALHSRNLTAKAIKIAGGLREVFAQRPRRDQGGRGGTALRGSEPNSSRPGLGKAVLSRGPGGPDPGPRH